MDLVCIKKCFLRNRLYQEGDSFVPEKDEKYNESCFAKRPKASKKKEPEDKSKTLNEMMQTIASRKMSRFLD